MAYRGASGAPGAPGRRVRDGERGLRVVDVAKAACGKHNHSPSAPTHGTHAHTHALRMSDTNANNDQTTTAIVSKDGVSAIAEMVFMEMKEQRDSIQRVAWERDKEACANAVFFRQLCAATSDEDDHRRFVDMRRDARKAAEKEFGTVFKGATNGATITNDLDDVQPAKKKRKPPSNRGITGLSLIHI